MGEIVNNIEYKHPSGLTITIETGEDGLPVIWIETPELDENSSGPLCRVYLNEHCMHNNQKDAKK